MNQDRNILKHLILEKEAEANRMTGALKRIEEELRRTKEEIRILQELRR